jgi:hypothetical protein
VDSSATPAGFARVHAFDNVADTPAQPLRRRQVEDGPGGIVGGENDHVVIDRQDWDGEFVEQIGQGHRSLTL